MRNAFVLSLFFAAPFAAVAQDVDLELVLLADASGSIDNAEIHFQRQGYAQAMTDPEVLGVIEQTAFGAIAVTYVEWAAAGTESIVVPWTMIDGADAAFRFAEALAEAPRVAYGRNAIGSALLTGMRLIEENDIEGWRKVIDFSGDSANNWHGPSVEDARTAILAAGITINGLAVLCRTCNGPSDTNLVEKYQSQIIGGPGAFVVAAEGGANFSDAVKRKLILEISGMTPSTRFAQQ
jgi:hypothetical protein